MWRYSPGRAGGGLVFSRRPGSLRVRLAAGLRSLVLAGAPWSAVGFS